jgi:hypothetical protein
MLNDICIMQIVTHRWGAVGERATPPGVVHDGAKGAEVAQFLLNGCGPFLPYSLEGVGGRLAEKCSPFFL